MCYLHTAGSTPFSDSTQHPSPSVAITNSNDRPLRLASPYFLYGCRCVFLFLFPSLYFYFRQWREAEAEKTLSTSGFFSHFIFFIFCVYVVVWIVAMVGGKKIQEDQQQVKMPENLSPTPERSGTDEISQGSDEMTTPNKNKRNHLSGGGYSPHSTTGSSTTTMTLLASSRKRPTITRTAHPHGTEEKDEDDDEEEETEEESSVPGASSDSDSLVDKTCPADPAATTLPPSTTASSHTINSTTSTSTTTTSLKQVLAASVKLAGSISRQHSEKTLQIVTDLLVSWQWLLQYYSYFIRINFYHRWWWIDDDDLE